MKSKSLFLLVVLFFAHMGNAKNNNCNDLKLTTCSLPWPSDFSFTVPQNDSPTGLSISVGDALFTAGATAELPKNMKPEDLLNGKSGFSAGGGIFFELDAPFQQTSLPEDGGDAVLVFDHTVDQRVPIGAVLSKPAKFKEDGSVVVAAYPRSRYNYGHQHIAVVTKKLKKEDGSDYAPSEGVNKALSKDGSDISAFYEPFVTYLEGKGVSRTNIVSITVFTTTTREETTSRLWNLLGDVYEKDVKVRYDMENSGYVNQDDVAYILEGELQSLDFRDKVTGQATDKGVPAWIKFTIWFPRKGFGEPAPLILYGHGLDSERSSATFATRDQLKDGYAVMAIDWPLHGSRALDDSGTISTIMKPENFGQITGMVTQAVVDMHSVLKAVNTSLQELDRLPEPDGIPDINASKVTYLGTSLGTILGHGFVATASGKGLNGAYLQVPGTNVARILSDSVVYNLVNFKSLTPVAATGSEASVLFGLTQSEIDHGDG